VFCGQSADLEAGTLTQENCTIHDIFKGYMNAEKSIEYSQFT